MQRKRYARPDVVDLQMPVARAACKMGSDDGGISPEGRCAVGYDAGDPAAGFCFSGQAPSLPGLCHSGTGDPGGNICTEGLGVV